MAVAGLSPKGGKAERKPVAVQEKQLRLARWRRGRAA